MRNKSRTLKKIYWRQGEIIDPVTKVSGRNKLHEKNRVSIVKTQGLGKPFVGQK